MKYLFIFLFGFINICEASEYRLINTARCKYLYSIALEYRKLCDKFGMGNYIRNLNREQQFHVRYNMTLLRNECIYETK